MRMTLKSMIAGALVSVAAVAASGSSHAACVLDTLANYIALGSTGCTIGDKTFFNFNYMQVGGTGPTAANVDVVPILGQFGFNFNALWNAAPTTTTDDILGFTAAVTDGTALISDAHLAILGSPDGGTISVGESVHNAATGALIGTLDAHLPPLGTDVGDITFDPVNGVIISKDIDVVGAPSGTAVVSLSQITQTVTQVPEPASLAIFGVSLFGMGAIRRRFRK